jgi:hypothetical protein
MENLTISELNRMNKNHSNKIEVQTPVHGCVTIRCNIDILSPGSAMLVKKEPLQSTIVVGFIIQG